MTEIPRKVKSSHEPMSVSFSKGSLLVSNRNHDFKYFNYINGLLMDK